jgi:hypothetical protein
MGTVALVAPDVAVMDQRRLPPGCGSSAPKGIRLSSFSDGYGIYARKLGAGDPASDRGSKKNDIPPVIWQLLVEQFAMKEQSKKYWFLSV